MKKIIAYHPFIAITGTDKAIRLDLDDWYSQDEVMTKLGEVARHYNVNTVGQLAESIAADPNPVRTNSVLDGDCTEAPARPTLRLSPDHKI